MRDDIAKDLRDTYTRWNNPPSPELPEGAGVLLRAADEIERLHYELATMQRDLTELSYKAERARHNQRERK